MKLVKAIVPVFFIFALSSCEKQDDFSKIKNDYTYTGSFSVPVGHANFGLDEADKNIPNDYADFPDTLRSFDSIVFEHKMQFDYESVVLDTTKVEALHFAVVLHNDFPASATFQVYFADGSDTKIDSLFDDGPQTINASTVDASGNVTNQGYYINADIPVTREKYSHWNSIKQVILSGSLNNEDTTQEYEYYKNYDVYIDLGVRIDFNFKIRDL